MLTNKEFVSALRLAKIRLQICLGRMKGCNDTHEVSLIEIPAWLDEMNDLITRAVTPPYRDTLCSSLDWEDPTL